METKNKLDCVRCKSLNTTPIYDREENKYDTECLDYGHITHENIAHKVELDLMTNLHYKFITPIVIQIKEVKREELNK